MYDTKQKNYILEVLKENKDKHLNSEEILELLKVKNYKVSQATLYRYLDKLEEVSIIRKFTKPHLSKACYQYIDEKCSHSHFHMICIECNKLIHLDCDLMNKFISHIEEHHEFKVLPEKVIYYGYCKKCRGER